MIEDFERCYRAVESRDSRFDGWIYTGVHSTGIYCRPSCPARTPLRKNVTFYRSPAAAQEAGLRACKRCRPDASPGSPEWNLREDLVGRAMRLILDGVVDRQGVTGLASRLGYTERQVLRQLKAEVGAGPLAIARAQRAQTARTLIESSDLPMTEIVFAAGFSSIRQFNDVVREVFALSPTEIRKRRLGTHTSNGTIAVRLAFRDPYPVDNTMGFLGARCIDGVEALSGSTYRRSLRLPRGDGIVELAPADKHFVARLSLSKVADLSAAVARSRALLDLDADPTSIGEVLRTSPSLRNASKKHPGLRVTGAVDGFEMAVRALVGQQVSVRGARTILGQLVARFGDKLARPEHQLSHLFPTAATIAEANLSELPMPGVRRNALKELATRVANEEISLDRGSDRVETRKRLLAIPGIGEWTAEYVAMRALGDPDAFPATDLGIRKGAKKLGLPSGHAAFVRSAERWAPYRAYAAQYLWARA